jgi:hypothetical protein
MCDKIILAKSCLAKFEKRLSKLYEQLSKCKSSSYENTFTTTSLLKKIELYVWQFKRWAWVVRLSVIKNCVALAHNYYIKQTISANPPPTSSLSYPKHIMSMLPHLARQFCLGMILGATIQRLRAGCFAGVQARCKARRGMGLTSWD